MQVKFNLSKETKAYFQPDGKTYLVVNKTGKINLTMEELRELSTVLVKAEESKQDVGFSGD